MKLVINLPAFNEEQKIAQTLSKIPRQLEGINEIVVQVIDDGSVDQTFSIAQKSGADFVYSHSRNKGIGVTFRTAVEKALENQADIMVNIDADGQFNPQDIQKLIEPILQKKADITSATRFGSSKAKNMPALKYILNLLAAKIIGWFLNYRIEDLTCGFRAYNRESLLRLNLPGNFTYTQETIIDAIGKNLKIVWIPVTVTYFPERKSRVVRSIFQYVSASFRLILKAVRDVRPMKFFGIPAFILISLSFLAFAYFFALYLESFKITPYRHYLLLAITLLLVGLQFLVFALMADMIKTTRRLIEDQTYFLRKKRYEQTKKTD